MPLLFPYRYLIMLATLSFSPCQCQQQFRSICSDSPGAPQCSVLEVTVEGALCVGSLGLQLSLNFATTASKSQLLLLCCLP